MGPARAKTRSPAPLGLADLARFRQAAYRLFGEALRFPEPERLATLGAVARELHAQQDALAGFAFFPRWSDALTALAGVDGGSESLQQAYGQLFVAHADGVCPPVASRYLAPDAPALLMARVEREYAAAGMSPAPDLAEPPDHAAVELEFMALLCAEEGRAWRGTAVADGLRELEREGSFLAGHLHRWFPAFAGEVAARDADGFYALLADAARVFISHDRDFVEALARGVQEEGA